MKMKSEQILSKVFFNVLLKKIIEKW